ncbi:MAG: LSM domain-containing protein [Candidatus Woesearchaeota archaeon]
MTLPLDEIARMIGQNVTVILKNGKEMKGKLLSFDLNANVGIEIQGNVTFLQGQEVTVLSCLDSKQ